MATIRYQNNLRNSSALLLYTKTSIDSGRVNVRHLQTALTVITNAIQNCCFPKHKVSVVGFLNTFYKLLNGMARKYSLNKLKAVQNILQEKVDCCSLENA